MIAMYGMSPMQPGIDPDEWRRRLQEQRRKLGEWPLPSPSTTVTLMANPVTKEDLAELRRALEAQMLALLGEVQRLRADLAAKPKRKRARRGKP